MRKNHVAHGVTLYYFSPTWKLQQVINAKKANISSGKWSLLKGTLTLFVDDFSLPLVKNL